MNEFAMHDAAKNGDLERVRQLIEAGVSVDILNKRGQTPLHVAARYGQYDAAVLFIDSECDLDIKDRHGRTPLMCAAEWDEKDIVDLLIHRGGLRHVNCVDDKGRTLLHFLIDTEDGDLERVRQLIEAGVPVDSLDKWGQTPLHLAACYGRYEAVGLLIDSECDLDIKDRHGRTPLMCAAKFGKKDIVDLLIHRGGLRHVNCVDEKGRTLLHHASLSGLADIVRLILDNREADLNAVEQEEGDTPLICAATVGDDEIAALLIRAGADVNRSNKRKVTALHFAVLFFHIRVIQVLLEKEGLDLSPQDVEGQTPLHIASLRKYSEAIKLLLDEGADIHVKNNRGETALNIGIRWRLAIEEIRLFVQKGAFLESCDYECIFRDPYLKENVLKDVELCTQSVVNKFNHQSLPALNSIAYFARRLPNVNNFKLGAQHIDEVKNLVKCEIEKNTFCNVVRVHPISLSALCVQSLITCQSGKKRAASTGFSHPPFKKNRN